MKFEDTVNDNCQVIKLSQRFTFADSEAFRMVVGAIGKDGLAKTELDLTDLEFMDSAGLGMMLLAYDAAQNNNTELVIRCPDGIVKRMLKLAKIEDIIAFVD